MHHMPPSIQWQNLQSSPKIISSKTKFLKIHINCESLQFLGEITTLLNNKLADCGIELLFMYINISNGSRTLKVNWHFLMYKVFKGEGKSLSCKIISML